MKLCTLVSAFVAVVNAHDGLPINPELVVPGFPDCVQVQNKNGQSDALFCFRAACMKLAVKQRSSTVILTISRCFNNFYKIYFVCAFAHSHLIVYLQQALTKLHLPLSALKNKLPVMM